ncbi:MAG: glycosyltransferase family 2 protein [Verrucomicrobiota bacterium]
MNDSELDRRHPTPEGLTNSCTFAVSVVIPSYRAKKSLPELFQALKETLDDCAESWEVILVDDASPDDSYLVMQKLRQEDPRLTTVRLSRNRGQHYATLCGLKIAQGSVIITLDDDMQHHPADIPRFLAKLQEGYDIVMGKISQKEHSAWRNFASQLVQSLVSRILGKPKSLYLSSYRALSRRAVNSIGAYRGVHVYMPALMFNAVPTSQIVNIDVAHHERAYGQSNYSIPRLVRLFSYLLINHSFIPLRVTTAWGVFLSIASFLFAAALVVKTVLSPSAVAGWTSTVVILSFLFGNAFLAVGVLGEYIGRLVEQMSQDQQSSIYSVNDEPWP